MKGIYLARTTSGSTVTLVIAATSQGLVIIALANDTPFPVILTSAGYEIHTKTPVPLYVIKKDNLSFQNERSLSKKEDNTEKISDKGNIQ